MDQRRSEQAGPAGRRGAKAYQAAVEAVVSILVGVGIGWWADGKLGTSPVLLLIGLAFGFASFILRLTRLRRLVEAAAAEAERDRESD